MASVRGLLFKFYFIASFTQSGSNVVNFKYFQRLSLPENKLYPQYGLHVYGEGIFAEKLRKMW